MTKTFNNYTVTKTAASIYPEASSGHSATLIYQFNDSSNHHFIK